MAYFTHIYRISFFVFAGLALTQVARATDYVRMTSGDPSGQSGFDRSACWSDGLIPHDDADYIVTNNFLLRGPETGGTKIVTNHVFNGRSLTIGTTSSAGRFGLATIGFNSGTTVADLILVNGQLRQIRDDFDSYLYGAITVQSPASKPFAIQSSASNTRTIHICSDISGEEGTALLFSSDGTSARNINYLCGDNENYFGTMTLGGGSGNILVVVSANGLGGDLSTYNQKGVVVKDDATIRFDPSSVAYANRGLYVDSSGAVIRQAGGKTQLCMPLSGDGSTLVKNGSGQISFSNTWTGVTVDVQDGNFILMNGCPAPGEGANAIVSGGVLGMCDATGANLPISMSSGWLSPYGALAGDMVASNATVTGGGMLVHYYLGRYDTLTLDGASTFTPSKFTVKVVNMQLPTDTNRYPVLVIPTSVGTLTEDMLEMSCAEDEYGYPPCLKAEVETVDGVQTLYLSRTNGVVRLVVNQSSGGSWDTASAWSDGIGLREGVDFLIDASLCSADYAYFGPRTPSSDAEEVFAGRSLTVHGTDTKQARLMIKSGALACDDLRLGLNSWVCGSGMASGVAAKFNQYVTGTVTVASSATRGSPAVFATTWGRTFEVQSELKGTGKVCASATAVNTNGKVVFTRPNPEFEGKFLVKTNYTNAQEAANSAVQMGITCEECLGATPDSLVTNVVELWNGGQLAAVCDVTLDDPTRGITVLQGGGMNAYSGTVFTVKSPITFKGSLYKWGDGTLVLDSTNVVNLTTAGVGLRGGCMQVNQPGTFWGFRRFRVFNGASLLFPLEAANEASGTYGIAMSTEGESPFVTTDDDGATYYAYCPVKFDADGTAISGTHRIVLCSVTESAAEYLRSGAFDIKTSFKGYNCTIEEDAVTYKGTSLRRFTAVLRPSGAYVIIR